ncbi:MAG: hypothetical protein QOH70_2958 [Blastocatellia bacterium]|nr:hypothetical protein [Blastocatellia bacterium]
MKIFDDVAAAELAFEWLNHFRHDLPIIVTRNPIDNFSLADAHVCDYRDRLVITAKIAKRRQLSSVWAARHTGSNSTKTITQMTIFIAVVRRNT